jgi:hypothetical protein
VGEEFLVVTIMAWLPVVFLKGFGGFVFRGVLSSGASSSGSPSSS